MNRDRWIEVERLYHEALARDERERADFLRNACGSDDSLRREVESLVEHETRAQRFLDAPAIDVVPAMLLSPDAPASLVGRRLGAYEITALIGSGGAGVLYRARATHLRRRG